MTTLNAPHRRMAQAIAVSLYTHNVRADERMRELRAEITALGHNPPLIADVYSWIDNPYWATEMPYLVAYSYQQLAFARYLEEATTRVECELDYLEKVTLPKEKK